MALCMPTAGSAAEGYIGSSHDRTASRMPLSTIDCHSVALRHVNRESPHPTEEADSLPQHAHHLVQQRQLGRSRHLRLVARLVLLGCMHHAVAQSRANVIVVRVDNLPKSAK